MRFPCAAPTPPAPTRSGFKHSRRHLNRAAYPTPPEHISRVIRGKGGHTNSPPTKDTTQKDRQHKRRGPTSEPRQQPIKQHYNVQNTQICGDAKSQKDEAKTAREARLLSVVSKQRNTKTNSQPIDHTRTPTNTETGQKNPLWDIPCQQIIRTAVNPTRVALQISQLTSAPSDRNIATSITLDTQLVPHFYPLIFHKRKTEFPTIHKAERLPLYGCSGLRHYPSTVVPGRQHHLLQRDRLLILFLQHDCQLMHLIKLSAVQF